MDRAKDYLVYNPLIHIVIMHYLFEPLYNRIDYHLEKYLRRRTEYCAAL